MPGESGEGRITLRSILKQMLEILVFVFHSFGQLCVFDTYKLLPFKVTKRYLHYLQILIKILSHDHLKGCLLLVEILLVVSVCMSETTFMTTHLLSLYFYICNTFTLEWAIFILYGNFRNPDRVRHRQTLVWIHLLSPLQNQNISYKLLAWVGDSTENSILTWTSYWMSKFSANAKRRSGQLVRETA